MYNIPYIDYDVLENQQRLENVEELLQNIDDPKLKVKIENFSQKFNLSPEFVLQKIVDDNIFALNFAIKPNNQTFHQRKAEDFIKQFPLINDFKALPSGGDNSLFVLNGTVIQKKNLTSKTNSKSLDFYWTYTYKNKNLKFYASHKYTKCNGGSQDNQYNDLL